MLIPASQLSRIRRQPGDMFVNWNLHFLTAAKRKVCQLREYECQQLVLCLCVCVAAPLPWRRSILLGLLLGAACPGHLPLQASGSSAAAAAGDPGTTGGGPARREQPDERPTAPTLHNTVFSRSFASWFGLSAACLWRYPASSEKLPRIRAGV